MRNLLFCFAAFMVLSASCAESKEETPALAQIGTSKLEMDDVLAVLPKGLSADDSCSFVAAYIDQWIEEELVYQQGLRHLPNLAELLQQVEEYQHILITQAYEQELLRQYEQDLSDAECLSFYEKYSKQLLLREALIKGFYVKVPVDGKTHHKKLKEWLKQLQEMNTDSMEELEQYLQLHAVDYEGFLDQWIPLSFISERLPELIVDPTTFLKLKIQELDDDSFSYFLLLTDYRLEGEESPYEYALPQIKEVMLNEHRREFLDKAHKSMREHALETGNLIINTSNTK